MHAFYLGSILGVVLAVGDFREGGIPRDVEGDGVGKRRKGIAVYLWKKKKMFLLSGISDTYLLQSEFSIFFNADLASDQGKI
jgi:hypothetical protein